MKNVCFIQPIIAKYTAPVLAELGKHWRLTVLYSPAAMTPGYADDVVTDIAGINCREIPMRKLFGAKLGMRQVGICRILKGLRPDAVIIFANLRFVSFWTTVIWCHLHRIPVYPRGHGVYRTRRPGFFLKIAYRILFRFLTAYIAYTSSVADSLRGLGLPDAKISVAENSLTNRYCVLPSEKTGAEHGILFIGRLRRGCGLGLLIDAVKSVRDAGHAEVTVDVIGDGPLGPYFREQASMFPWIRMRGAVYDSAEISRMSRDCMFGCYPGNAGLSVVHMMSLSLPPVTHDNLVAHQGPEPSYIEPGNNGLLFDHRDPADGLASALVYMITHPVELKRMQSAAFNTYKRLTNPSLAARLISIVGD